MTKFPADAVFPCDKSPVIAARPGNAISYTQCLLRGFFTVNFFIVNIVVIIVAIFSFL